MSEKNELPKTWCLAKLDEISGINPTKEKIQLTTDSQVHFVPMAKVDEEFGGIDISGTRPLAEVERGYTQFAENDVLFAKITPCMENGKVAVVPTLPHRIGYGSTEFHVVRPRESAVAKWLGYWLSQRSLRQDARRNMTGSAGQLRVPSKWLEEQQIPVAPLAEQRRIVAKIEELFSELDAGVAALQRVRANLKRYRASVLKAAVEGKLTEAWRAEHRDLEPASDLLRRILTERRQRWETDQRAKHAATGKPPPKDWQAKYAEPTPPDLAGLPPHGWCWASVDQLAEVSTGTTPSRTVPEYYKGGTIPWVMSSAVNELWVREGSENVTERAIQETSLKLYPKNTLIVALYGEGKTRGKVSELLIEATVNQAISAIVMSGPAASCRPYVKSFLLSNYENLRRQSAGGMQPNLNLGLVRKIRIPLPPLAEQTQIVAEVEERLSIVAATEGVIEASLKRAARLRQSILKRAFAGQLVPQDPADEPASVLLERLRAKQPVHDGDGRSEPPRRTRGKSVGRRRMT